MRNTKRILAAVGMALAVTLSAVPAQIVGGTQIVAQAATVKLSKKSVTLDVGKIQKLKVSGTKAKVKWSSTDASVAKVSQSGVVTAVSSGSTTIKAKIGKKTLSCKITVKEKINKLVYEDSNIRVYFTGLKKDTYPDELIACLTIENLSDNNLEINNSDSTSINDTMVDATLYQELAPHKKAYVTMFTYDDYAVGLSLNEITDIQTSLVVWNEDSSDSDYYTTEPISLLK
nr:MAG TPA: tail tube protein [Caudoviricetes sp.]